MGEVFGAAAGPGVGGGDYFPAPCYFKTLKPASSTLTCGALDVS